MDWTLVMGAAPPLLFAAGSAWIFVDSRRSRRALEAGISALEVTTDRIIGDRDAEIDQLREALRFARGARLQMQIEELKFDALGEPRTRYVRVTLNRSHCVMRPSEGDCYIEEARNAGDPDWERYIVRDVWLSEREFDALPEHTGF